MALKDWFKKKEPKNESEKIEVATYFKSLSAYTPVFTTYEGGVYEMELTRAAIHAFASACSKLKPVVTGAAKPYLNKRIQFRANPILDISKFLYRTATILEVQNNVFILPIEDDLGRLVGYYPALPEMCELLESGGVIYLRCTFASGDKIAIEFNRVGVLNKFQYRDDVFGEDNRTINPTMQLIHTENQGIVEGIKSALRLSWLAKINNLVDQKDIDAARDRFAEAQLSIKNKSGVATYDNTFSDLKQIEVKPFAVEPDQAKQITDRVFSYFGVSEKILQNNFDENTWNAYYEGKIEPFAVQLSLVLTLMTFTQEEINRENIITLTSSRLQYASNSTKLSVSTQLLDRGLMTPNEAREIWQLPPIDNGDTLYIRKEYSEVSKLDGGNANAPAAQPKDGQKEEGKNAD